MTTKFKNDDATVYNDEKLIRRRFYLSKESLAYIDSLAVQYKQSPSLLLDAVLKQLAQK